MCTHRGGTYLVMEGPQFSSLAESELYRSWNCDVVGMTNMPAKKTLGGVVPEWVVMLTGSVFVAFAAFCFAAAVWRELYPGTPPRRPDVRRLPRALLFALNGFLALVALAALLGVVVWPHRRELTTAIGHPERFTCGTRRMIAGMAGTGASRPLRRIPAIVSFLNPQPALSLVGGTALHAPHLPFAIPVGISSVGWISAVPDLPGR